MARISIIRIKATLTPTTNALAKLFGDLADNVTLVSAGRIKLVAEVPFVADELDSFAQAQKAASKFCEVAADLGEAAFDVLITTVDESEAPKQLPFAAGDDGAEE